jgi:hypothetical protein
MIETRTPAEYRPFLAVEADTAAMARTGYVFCALRRELDWHTTAALHAEHEADTRAAQVCALAIRDTVRRMLEGWQHWADALAMLRADLNAHSMRIEGIAEPLAIDAEQLPYRADAAARIALIERGAAHTF